MDELLNLLGAELEYLVADHLN